MGNGTSSVTLYHITRKQKEQLEYLLANGLVPAEAMKDEKSIAELFKSLSDDSGNTWLRYKDFSK